MECRREGGGGNETRVVLNGGSQGGLRWKGSLSMVPLVATPDINLIA